jgi:hypothetical protein
MTPQEQQLVADLFNRLASLEGQRRDPDAERLIREGLGRAPNSVYALVQTVLVQDETLKLANARIEELERGMAAPAESSGGFLDNVRGMFGGRSGSVPSVKPGGQGSSGVWGSRPDASPPSGQPSGQPWGNPQGYPQGGYPPSPPPGYPPAGYPPGAAPAGGGHSFLGTAAATVAGVVGGAMLLNGIRSMMGGSEGFSPGHHDPSGGLPHGGGSPWDSGSGHGGGDQGSGTLSQDAGLGDIGGGGRRSASAAYDNDTDNNNADDSGSFLGGNVDDLAGGQQDDDQFDTGDFDGGDGGDFDTA